MVESQVSSTCPGCGGLLEEKGMQEPLVIESQPLKAKRVLYGLPQKYCPHCRKVFQPRAPGVPRCGDESMPELSGEQDGA